MVSLFARDVRKTWRKTSTSATWRRRSTRIVAFVTAHGLNCATLLCSHLTIECRVNAENPQTFRPSPGRITYYHPPGGLGVRVDSAVYQGYTIPPYYDSLVGKLIVHGADRAEACARMRRALDELVIEGIQTTIPLHRRIFRNRDFLDSQVDTTWVERVLLPGRAAVAAG